MYTTIEHFYTLNSWAKVLPNFKVFFCGDVIYF